MLIMQFNDAICYICIICILKCKCCIGCTYPSNILWEKYVLGRDCSWIEITTTSDGLSSTNPPTSSETVSEKNVLGCENWEIFHEDTQKCYSRLIAYKREKGPCGIGMTFNEVDPEPSSSSPMSKYGICRCISATKCWGRPVIFWKPGNRCYNAFDQGPCQDGEWLILNEDLEAECRRTSCPNMPQTRPANDMEAASQFYDQRAETSFNFTFNGTCYQTGTKAFCTEDRVAFFAGTLNFPQCFPPSGPACDSSEENEEVFNTQNRPLAKCGPNEKRVDRDCKKIVNIED